MLVPIAHAAPSSSSAALTALERGDYWEARRQLSLRQGAPDAAWYFAEGLIQQYNNCNDAGRSLAAALSSYYAALRSLERKAPSDDRATLEAIQYQITQTEAQIRSSVPKPIAESVIERSQRSFIVVKVCEDEQILREVRQEQERIYAELVAAEEEYRKREAARVAALIMYDERCLAIFDDSWQIATQWEVRSVGLGIKTKVPLLRKRALRHCLLLEVRGPSVQGVIDKVKSCIKEVVAGAVVAGVAAEYASAGASGGSGGISVALAAIKVGIPACLALKAVAQEVIDQIDVDLLNRSHWTDWAAI